MEKIENINKNNWLDKIAIFLSATCAVHCLLTPVLIIALPIVSTSFLLMQTFTYGCFI